MNTITLTDVNEYLHYLMGERSIPQGSVVDREVFLQSGFERVWRDFDWDFSMGETTIDLASGEADAPADYDEGGAMYIWDGDDQLERLASTELYIRPGRKAFRVKYDKDAVKYVVVTGYGADGMPIQYKLAPPTLDAEGNVFFSKQLIAYSALIDAKQAMAPGRANVQQEVTLYEAELKRARAPFRRQRQRKAYRTKAEMYGSYTGQVDDYRDYNRKVN